MGFVDMLKKSDYFGIDNLFFINNQEENFQKYIYESKVLS